MTTEIQQKEHKRPKNRIPLFFIHFVKFAGPFWKSENKQSIRLQTLALMVLTVLQVGIAIVITEWSSSLFNGLEQHSTEMLWRLMWFAILILVVNVAVTATHLNVKRSIILKWRAWLTDRVIGQWMNEGHQIQVTHMPGKHDNPDGRIAEDIRISTEYAVDLCHSLVYALLLLIGFTKILWTLSGTVHLSWGLLETPVHGYLVWLAFAYASAASFLGMKIGRPLTHATDVRQTEEANFRFGLVRARENSEAIALVHGETDERRRFFALFQGIINAWNRQTNALSKILMFTTGYSVVSMAFPIIAAAPRYISGAITLGSLIQSVQSFQQMAAALSWPVDNLAKVAEWRASVERVLGLAQALKDLQEDINHLDSNTIRVERTGQPHLIFHDVSIAEPDGIVILDGFEAKISRGERVFLAGDPALGGKLFKVMAGLWPWGRGRVELPKGNTVFFMPPRPYFPIVPLREAVSYPSHPDSFGANEIIASLKKVGMEEFITRLDEKGNWEKCLAREQQQRLGFARLLLHKPRWIMLQEALDSLAEADAKKIMQMISDEFPDSAIITLTRQTAMEAFHQRKINIECSRCEKVLKKETRKRREQNRRGHVEVSTMNRVIGSLRKDRRKV